MAERLHRELILNLEGEGTPDLLTHHRNEMLLMEGGWYHINGVKDWDMLDRILDMSVLNNNNKKTEKQEPEL